MAYNLNDINNTSQFDFGKEVEAILKYLAPGWDIKALPKGYAKYRKGYQDYDGMEELDEKALMNSFKGHDDSGTLSPPFPVRVSLPHVTYDDTCQGRPPLETLIGAILGHGMLLGMRIAAIDTMSEANRRMNEACHAMDKLRYPLKDENIKLTLLMMNEADEYRNRLAKPVDEIRKEYREKRLGFVTNRMESIKQQLKDKTSVTFKRDDESLRVHYEVLSELFYPLSDMQDEKMKKFLAPHGINYKRDAANDTFILSLKKKRIKKL